MRFKKDSNLNSKIKYVLLFLFSFLISLYLLEWLFLKNNNAPIQKQNDPVHEYAKMPSSVVEVNGKKVRMFTGVSDLSASELISKMKEEITNNPIFKLIHENNAENRCYLSYYEEGIMISAIVTGQADGACNYQIYKAEKSLADENNPLEKLFPAPPDAITVLTLKGKGNQTIYSYTTKLSQADIFSFYRKELNTTGYREEKLNLPEGLKIDEVESNEILFIKDRKNLMISVTTDPAGNGQMVYIVGS